MLELTAFILIVMMYIIPLNLFFYILSEETVIGIVNSQSNISSFLKRIPLLSNILKGPNKFATALFYILYVALLFIVIYLALKYIVVKFLFTYADIEIDEGAFLLKYSKGQRNINALGSTAMVLVLIIHLLFSVYDVKILVLGFLCIVFIFRKLGRKKTYETEKHEARESGVNTETLNNASIYRWSYSMDPLGIQRPVCLEINIPVDMDTYKKYQSREHSYNTNSTLQEYVLGGICQEVSETARQIKKLCTSKGFNTFHQISAVMAFQQSLNCAHSVVGTKQGEEYIRYPLETMVDREVNLYSHGICAAAILFAMGYEVLILRILSSEQEERLAIAVEGAEGITGNFLTYNSKSYYCCEITSGDNVSSSLDFRVGEIPDMPGANITVIPIKELGSQLLQRES